LEEPLLLEEELAETLTPDPGYPVLFDASEEEV
jgi:hypothetical protein